MTEFFDTRPAQNREKRTPYKANYREGDFLCVVKEITEVKKAKNSDRFYRMVMFQHAAVDEDEVRIPSGFIGVETSDGTTFYFDERGQEFFDNLCIAIGVRSGDRVSKEEFIGAPLKIKVVKNERAGKTYWNTYLNECNKMESNIILSWKRNNGA